VALAEGDSNSKLEEEMSWTSASPDGTTDDGRQRRTSDGKRSGEEEEEDQEVMSMTAVDGLVWVGWRQGDLSVFDAGAQRQRFNIVHYHKDALTGLVAISPGYCPPPPRPTTNRPS
jgi:hypothetical protein